jgi:enoyl-CoA hydratase/carnithine racemase
VLLLRGAEGRSVDDGLVAESAVYSMLQAGPEFAAWRDGRAAVRTGSGVDPGDAPVQVGRDGDVLTVTLSRPAVHNALNTAMRDALVEALTVGVADPTVTVVLQGAGPSFCSGGDLGEFGTTPDPATAHLIRLTRSPAMLAAHLAPRLVAQVHGACIGAGTELAAFATRVVAHPGTFFALPELALGLVPGAGGTVSLPRRIGRHRTAWLVLSGERIGVERARRWGLVDEIA